MEPCSLGWSIFFLLIAWVCYGQLIFLFQRFISGVPVVGKTWLDVLTRKSISSTQVVSDAYNNYSKKSRAFRTGSNAYIIPPSTFAEARKLPTATLDSAAANEDLLFLAPFLGHDHTDVVNFVRQDVSRSIPALIPAIMDEVCVVFKKNFPPTLATKYEENGATWYKTGIHPTTLTAVGCVASRIFIGKHYSRDCRWTRMASDFANGVIIQTFLLRWVPKSLMPLVAPLMPTTRRLRTLKEMVRGDVMSYIEKPAGEPQEYDDSEALKDTVLLPLMVKFVQSKPAYASASDERILAGTIGRLMGLMFAAIDTTTMTFTQVIYDLISHPHGAYAEPMRQEISAVLASHDGVWSVQSLAELKLLDSFIKESQRLHPIGLVLGARNVMTSGGYTFSGSPEYPGSGAIHIPEGAMIQLPVYGVHSDPLIYSDPESFHGFRFAKDAVSSSQPSDKFMSFGHGRHACPGRHLALVVVKLMMIEFLTEYEWKEMDRPKDWNWGTACLPDFKSQVSIRRKAD